MFWCRNSKKCIEKELRCDGNRDCNLGEDEMFCGKQILVFRNLKNLYCDSKYINLVLYANIA